MSEKKHTRILKITLLLTGSMTVLAGAGITAAIPEIKDYFKDESNAELLSKLILTISSLFVALLAPFAGKIIDSTGRKKLLLFSLLLYAIAGTSGFYLKNIYALLAGRAFLGVAVAGLMTINTTLIGDYFVGKERNKFMGWQGAFMAFGGVVFVSAGGFLADFSWRMPFLVYSFSLIILILSIFFIYEPEVLSSKDLVITKKVKPKRLKKYRLVYLTGFFGMLFFYMIPTQIPFILSGIEKISNSTIGYSISGAMLAGAFLSINYQRLKSRFSFHFIYTITFILMGLGFLIISFSSGFAGILTGLITAGFGTGLMMPNTNLWMISLAPAAKRGRLVGLLNFAVYSGQFLSPILIFPLIKFHSVFFSFSVCGILMLILASLFYFLPKIKKKGITLLYRQK